MNARPLLEVISTSPADSLTIEDRGADRIELVSALQIGGLTPSLALLRRSLEAATIPTMVMVRHHNQGFVLTSAQKRLLVDEAVCLVEAGAKGLVIGAITPEHTVDEQFLKLFREQISGEKIDVTFHKASDYTRNLLESYQTLVKFGVNRVLTQGGTAGMIDNQKQLKEVLQIGEIKTLLGGGVSSTNISSIIEVFKPKEVHIGTCVRQNRYGPVEGSLLEGFLAKMNYSN